MSFVKVFLVITIDTLSITTCLEFVDISVVFFVYRYLVLRAYVVAIFILDAKISTRHILLKNNSAIFSYDKFNVINPMTTF